MPVYSTLYAGDLIRGETAEWYVNAPHPAAADLARQLRTSLQLAEVLAQRGFDDPQAAADFLNPTLQQLLMPETLPGCEEAAHAIVRHIRDKQRIAIYGDYDVDGITASAILVHALREIGVEPDVYIPDRLEEGYGLNDEAIRHLVTDPRGPQANLIISVDCGITAGRQVELAKELGASIIITDHHAFDDDKLPNTVLVHPRLPGSTYENADLCGAGVAFKLAWQVGKEFVGRDRVSPGYREVLRLAAVLAGVGTVADVMPLVGENRILAKTAIQNLSKCRNFGLEALIFRSGMEGRKLTAYDIGFKIGPRLNAAGRIADARAAKELLITQDAARAHYIACDLEKSNRERQDIQKRACEEAVAMALAKGYTDDDCRTIVVASEGWHPGVVGLVASHLVREFHRPAVVISLSPPEDAGDAPGPDTPVAGSCRSVAGFDIKAALDACAEHLVSHGGHPAAAGLKILPQSIDAFRDAMLAQANRRLRVEDLIKRYDVIGTVRLDELHEAVVDDLERLEPVGHGFNKPLFCTGFLPLADEPRLVGVNRKTMLFNLMEGGVVRKCKRFGDGDRFFNPLRAAGGCRVLFEPEINEWNGRRMVELTVRDFCFKHKL